jgi:hypothetical protein
MGQMLRAWTDRLFSALISMVRFQLLEYGVLEGGHQALPLGTQVCLHLNKESKLEMLSDLPQKVLRIHWMLDTNRTLTKN